MVSDSGVSRMDLALERVRTLHGPVPARGGHRAPARLDVAGPVWLLWLVALVAKNALSYAESASRPETERSHPVTACCERT
jgi:hypothetical protein